MVSGSPGTKGALTGNAASAAHEPAQSPVSAEDAAGGDGKAQPGAVTAWDGFARFATTPVTEPPAPGAPARSLEERLGYYSQFVTVRTPAIDTLAKQVRTLMVLGRHQQVTARPSLILTGPAGAGKTTALLQVGRACHHAHTRRHGDAAAAGRRQGPPFATGVHDVAESEAASGLVAVEVRRSQAASGLVAVSVAIRASCTVLLQVLFKVVDGPVGLARDRAEGTRREVAVERHDDGPLAATALRRSRSHGWQRVRIACPALIILFLRPVTVVVVSRFEAWHVLPGQYP